jgi:hypothetical protein
MEIIAATITDEEIVNLDCSKIPFKIALRNLLNSKGIKFQDDGKVSAIVNENPTPLGILKSNKNDFLSSTDYLQIID